VAGFFWWQGTKDTWDMALAERYEQNLVALIKALRLLFNAPAAKFVTATLGQTLQSAASTTAEGAVLHALEAVDGTGRYGAVPKYPEFNGNVATVYAHPLSMGSTSGNHYGGSAETYMNVGEAMGRAMVGLLEWDGPTPPPTPAPPPAPTPPPTPTAPCDAATFESNVDYHDGQGLGHEPASSALACCQQCEAGKGAAAGCKFFTLAAGTCWYKANNDGRRTIAGAVSGAVQA